MIKNKPRNIHVRMIKHLRESHRLLGIWLAFFIIFLACTGILINHGNSLNLDTSKVKSTWLLNYYGIKAPNHLAKYSSATANKPAFYVTDQQVWWQQQLLLSSPQAIIAASNWQDMLVIATSQAIHLFDKQGQLVDVIDELSDLPTPISKLLIIDDKVSIRVQEQVYSSVDQLYSWQEADSPETHSWISEQPLLAEEQKHVSNLYRQQMLTWERVLLDAHSGRLFGNVGVLFMDFVALMLIVLSITGIYMWIRQSRARKR